MSTLTLQTTIETKTANGQLMNINIRLSDPCNNGHNDFAITAEIFKGKSRDSRFIESCGCLHNEILAVKPSLKPFIDLHLSDEHGLPMYAVENGYYWFCKDIKVFAKYMRIDLDTAKELRGKVFTKNDFSAWVETMKSTYLKQANEAKLQLAKLIESV